MNEYWHIPRASLVPSVTSSAVSSASSSNRSNKSYSNPPTLSERTTKQKHSNSNHHLTPINKTNQNNTNRRNRYEHDELAGAAVPKPSHHHNMQHHQVKKLSTYSNPAVTAAAAAAVLAAASAKRGSRSSQGSNDSNNSTRSAASGSLLLTAANLERFTEIQKQQNPKYKNGYLPSVHSHSPHHSRLTQELMPTIPSIHNNKYNANLLQAATAASAAAADKSYNQRTNGNSQQHQHHHYDIDDNDHNNVMVNKNENGDAIIHMDPNLNFIKTKDLDTVSIASSMHFTMVNGEAGQTKKPKRGLCDRGRQVTVLIVSMSTIFMLLIMGMVYALEMRAREMPQS